MSSEIRESSNLVDRINESSLNEYEQHTYEQLSQEFTELYPAAARAFELIPLMYNRLTLVDGLTHREAVAKIHNDHNHLSGFTERNIRRYLPGDNPKIPRRIRTSCPNNTVLLKFLLSRILVILNIQMKATSSYRRSETITLRMSS